jgi:hypothetical protein
MYFPISRINRTVVQQIGIQQSFPLWNVRPFRVNKWIEFIQGVLDIGRQGEAGVLQWSGEEGMWLISENIEDRLEFDSFRDVLDFCLILALGRDVWTA